MGAYPGCAAGVLDAEAGAVGGPGNGCVPARLGVGLDCEMAALSSLAITGLSASFLCSVCKGTALGLPTICS
jgi:hypothetical protein